MANKCVNNTFCNGPLPETSQVHRQASQLRKQISNILTFLTVMEMFLSINFAGV